jgi:hypothetical protein
MGSHGYASARLARSRHREDAWNLPVNVDHHSLEETFDEGLLAAPYREDPLSIQDELYNPDLNVVYAGGEKGLSHIKTCSLKRLVVTLATTDVNEEEQQMFFPAMNSSQAQPTSWSTWSSSTT